MVEVIELRRVKKFFKGHINPVANNFYGCDFRIFTLAVKDMFYEQDPEFRDFVSIPQNYIDELKDIQIISTPDCSLYRDMPLWEQIANIGVSRSVGYYLQQQGKYVIPNARWGDERTYTKGIFDYIPAFSGIPKNSVVSIGTYGCSKSKEDKYYLEAGLEAMLIELTPQDVIVYG